MSATSDPDLIPSIATERLHLRVWRPSDAVPMAANLTPAVTRWLASWPDPITEAFTAERIAKARADVAVGIEASYGVERLSDGALVGGIGVRLGGFDPKAPDAKTRAEVGYHLGESFHGRGYMTEAGLAVIAAAWTLMPGLQTIEAGVLPGNPGSEGVLVKLGMRRVNNRIIYSSARRVDELCHCYEIDRPAT